MSTHGPDEAQSQQRGPSAAELDRWLAVMKPDQRGLVPAVVQDARSGAVLMLAWMDAEALRRTVSTGCATYWSRSRQTYWVKGATSGHTQRVLRAQLDCDGDTVLLLVEQIGPACHSGSATCFDGAVLTPAERPRDG